MATTDTVVSTHGPVDDVRESKAAAWRRVLRLHFAPVTLTTGLLGVVGGEPSPKPVPVAIALVICALAYGIGQVMNDYFDRCADAINAPDRPLVTGTIDPVAALVTVSVAAAALIGLATALAPRVALWSLVAVVGHLVYATTKRFPLVGNIVNGADLAVMALIGEASTVKHGGLLSLPHQALLHWLLLAVVLAGYSFISYFKDIPGDRIAGYRTIPVMLGPWRARWGVLPFPVCGVVAAMLLALFAPGMLNLPSVNHTFWVILTAAAGLFAVAVFAIVADPERFAYHGLVWYTRASVVLVLAIAAMYQPLMAVAAIPPILAFFELTIRETANTGQA